MLSFLAGLMGTAAFGAIIADALGVFDSDDTSTAEADEDWVLDEDPAAGDPDGESPLTVATDTLSQLPRVEGTDGDDVISGSEDAELIEAGKGDDYVAGYEGDDVLDGGAGADRLWGDGGEDTLIGGDGDDVLNGGDQDDLLLGGDGDDLLQGALDNDIMSGGLGMDTLQGGMGDDLLHGGEDDDQLAGGWGDDTLTGGAGADALFGEAGNDVLHGNDEDGDDDLIRDYLNGGAGEDTLHLGADDWASGGDGADLFMLAPNPAGPAPTVADFNPAEDSLVLSYDGAASATPQVSVAPDPDNGANVIVFADGHAIAVVLDAAGLTADMVVLQPFGEAAGAAAGVAAAAA
jgi:Ca2+-binding RTX toxin-like protein